MITIDVAKIENACEIIKTSKDSREVMITLDDLIHLDKILIFLDPSTDPDALLEKQHPVLDIMDSKYRDSDKMIIWFRRLLTHYHEFLKVMRANTKLEYDEKIYQLKFIREYFATRSRYYDFTNRFFFTNDMIIMAVIDGKEHPILFEALQLSETQLNMIRELLQIRSEAYAALANHTELLVFDLELNVHQYPKIELTDKGEMLVTEFIMGIEGNLTYIKSTDDKITRHLILDFFGIKSRTYTKKKDSIQKRYGGRYELHELVENIEIKLKKAKSNKK